MRSWIVPATLLMLALVAAAAASSGQAAERRVALIIGNGAYETGPLRNAVNDARAMAAKLQELGFRVIARENTTKLQFERAVADFGEALTEGDVGLFYYAGHALQLDGRNYLLPVDARVSGQQRVKLESVDVEVVLDQLAAASARVSLVVLDACRDNPFERRFRSGSGGLAQINAPQGTLIAYATAPGRTSFDGTGENGIYTAELLKGLDLQGQPVEEVFKQVRVQVARATNNAQVPWENSSLTGSFYFRPATAAAPPAPAPPAPPPANGMEMLYWQSIQNSQMAADFDSYLKRYPGGAFADLARNRLAMLSARPPEPRTLALPSPPPSPSPPSSPPLPSGVAVEDWSALHVALRPANIRAEPDGRGRLLSQLKQDDSVQVTGRVTAKDWLRVDHQGGQGYVAAEFLSPVEAEELDVWGRLKGSNRYDDIAAFTRQYPKSPFRNRAEAMLAALKQPAGPLVPATPQRTLIVSPSPPAAKLKPGTVLRDCVDCPELVVLPAGRFRMGTASGTANERPVHDVSVRAFAAGRFEVTFAEWDACVAARACAHRPGDQGWGRGRRPVINISWNEAQFYVAWLARISGKPYRLMSEAEWEYAARAGSPEEDVKVPPGQANCNGCGSRWDAVGTAPAGSFAPNGFGLYDLQGNVAEWVEDCWNATYAGAPADGTAWTTGECGPRMARGGSWMQDPARLRAGHRYSADSGFRNPGIGFRVARAL